MKIRSLIALVAVVAAALAVPAAAQEGAPPAGRYQLTSGPDNSFVRLDTRTGAVFHCRQESGVWRCDPIMDSGLADRLSALADKVDRLSSDVHGLSLRLDTLAAAPAPPLAAKAGEQAAGNPTGFARAAVYRLLEIVRTLKHGRDRQT